MALRYCCIFFYIVILGKVSSGKTSSHYFALFLQFGKLVIYTFMCHNLTSIDVVSA